MGETSRDVRCAASITRGAFASRLERIPRLVRAAAYYAALHGFILLLLPWSAHVLAARYLPWRIEIGWGRAVGWVVFGICWLGYTFTSVLLVRRGRGGYIEFDPPKEFVATGPFRWCRNPIVVSVLGMVLGEALAFSSTGIFLLFLVGLPLAHLQVVLLEEPRLEKRFGQAYADYRRRVPRWIPRPPRRKSA
jgi:protein-S-isoprenylcysteine O-methyltransferase Ste14